MSDLKIKGKKSIALLLAAVMLSGTLLCGCGENGGDSEDSQGENSGAEQSVIDDTSISPKPDTSAADESSAAEASKTVTPEMMKWEFKPMNDLKFPDSKYTNIQPFKSLPLIKGTIAQPAYKLDVEKIQKHIREDSVLSKNIKYAEYNSERRTFKEYENAGTLCAYYRRNYLIGYRNDSKEKPISPTDDNVEISFGYSTDSTGYDSPEFYEFNVKNTKLGQEDLLGTVINIFGKEVGQYLIQAEMDLKNDHDDSPETLTYQRDFDTDDFNSTYTLQRKMTYHKNSNSYSYSFRVSLFDSSISRNNRYNKFEWGLHSYEPFVPTLDLSKMLPGDVGVTDLNNQQRFLDKALDYGGTLDSYGRTSFANSSDDAINIEEMAFDDGETVYDYEILGERKNEFDSDQLTGDVYLKINGVSDAKNKFTLRGYTITLPNCSIEKAKYKKKAELYEKIVAQCRKQASELFGYKEYQLKNPVQESTDEDIDLSSENEESVSGESSAQTTEFSIPEDENEKFRMEFQNQKIKIFGNNVNTEIVFGINPTDTVYKANITVKMLNN